MVDGTLTAIRYWENFGPSVSTVGPGFLVVHNAQPHVGRIYSGCSRRMKESTVLSAPHAGLT